jgi:N-acetylmuramate 1-kinase
VAAAEVLAEKDATPFPAFVEVAPHGRWTLPRFDARALLVELLLLPDWYLPHLTGAPTDAGVRTGFMDLWEPLVQRIGTLPSGLVLRDVIAPNLVWMGDGEHRAGKDRIGFLDFHDAMIGPAAYDIMSLTTDVRIDAGPELRAAMIEAYVATRRIADPAFDAEALDAAIALTSAQRNSKILGGFARLAIRDGKPHYLGHLPLVRRRLGEALSHPVLRPLRLWYERHRLLD